MRVVRVLPLRFWFWLEGGVSSSVSRTEPRTDDLDMEKGKAEKRERTG